MRRDGSLQPRRPRFTSSAVVGMRFLLWLSEPIFHCRTVADGGAPREACMTPGVQGRADPPRTQDARYAVEAARKVRYLLWRRDQSTSRCNDPAVAPTHDRVDPSDAGDCVAACCHPNAIGPFENRRAGSSVQHRPTLNGCRSCLGRRHDWSTGRYRAGHRHICLDGLRSGA